MLESKIDRIIALAVLATSVTLAPPSLAQQGEESSADSVPDPFEYRVPVVKLEDDDIIPASTTFGGYRVRKVSPGSERESWSRAWFLTGKPSRS